ncbi:MAG: YgfZ/GcvT domain-containing protein [Geminicoccaceae bacterium]
MPGSYVILDGRGVLAIEGEDARDFLQGLISNDIEKATDDNAIYAALLTPQGKYLFDFMIVQQGERLLLEAEASRLQPLSQRRTMYKFRARVEITDVSEEIAVVALPGDDGITAFNLPEQRGAATRLDDGIVFVDPRLSALGARAFVPMKSAQAIFETRGLKATDQSAYDSLRLQLGIPEGSRDLAVDKSTLLESGFEELNGVDFKKGCFVGQELTARMKYRALVKKRLMPVAFEGEPPASGAMIKAGDREIGEIRSAENGWGLALLRLDRLADVTDQGKTLMADGKAVTPKKPDWVNF